MRTCGIVKFFPAVLLIILPIVIGDHGFKDYQLKIGYGIKEFRALKWLNKIIGLDRDTDQPAPQFPPIKVHGKPFVVPAPIENPPPVSFNPSPSNNPPEPNNIQTKQIAEAPQVPNQNYSSAPQSPTHDSSSKSLSVDSTETSSSSFFSGFRHSYKDYLYMKWFHGSPKATYFNENPVPDKLQSVVDSKSEQVNYEEADDSEVNDNFSTDEQQPALFSFSDDSILSRMFNTIKRLAVPRVQKQDIGPLKFYDEPPKPQLFSVPPPVAFPSPYNPPQLAPPTQTNQVLGSSQLLNSHLANNPSVPVYNPPYSQPIQEEPARIVPELDISLPVDATTFKPPILGYDLSEAPEDTSTSPPAYNLPIPADNQPADLSSNVPDKQPVEPFPNVPDNQPAEPSSNVPDNQPAEPSSNLPDNNQPQTTISSVERTNVPLQTAYTNPIKRTSIDIRVQSEEPDYNALLLAYKPQVPNYA